MKNISFSAWSRFLKIYLRNILLNFLLENFRYPHFFCLSIKKSENVGNDKNLISLRNEGSVWGSQWNVNVPLCPILRKRASKTFIDFCHGNLCLIHNVKCTLFEIHRNSLIMMLLKVSLYWSNKPSHCNDFLPNNLSNSLPRLLILRFPITIHHYRVLKSK